MTTINGDPDAYSTAEGLCFECRGSGWRDDGTGTGWVECWCSAAEQPRYDLTWED